jgi:beta-lactamase superfamily II metal-dependent hydrolase
MNEVRYEYDVLSVGDADAIFIRHIIGNKQYIVLIDAGNAGDADKIKKHLWKCYHSLHINLAICTHPDGDHKDGFYELLLDNEITIDTFWLIDPAQYLTCEDLRRYTNERNAEKAVRKIWQESPDNDNSLNLIDLALEKCDNVISVSDGVTHDILPIAIVGPEEHYYKEVVKEMVAEYDVHTYEDSLKGDFDEHFKIKEHDKKNVIDDDEDPSSSNASSLIVLYVPGDGKRLLFAGDANTTSLQIMLDKYERLRNVDLLKVPHHGSHRNLNTRIIDALSPKISIISAAGNDEHPNDDVADYLAKYGNVYSTHLNDSSLHGRSGNMPPRKGAIIARPYRSKRI